MAFLSGYSYRKSITLSRASGAVTNYQMRLLVGESSGATGEDVDCEGKCLSTFNDLRFTASDGTTLLDYWIESISGTTPNQLATVWIEFDSIGTGSTTFYMYYGNSGASAASNGANTFIYFQDFNSLTDGDLNGQDSWSGSTAFDVQTSVKYEGAKAVKIEDGGVTVTIGRSISVISYNMFIQMHLYSTDVSNQYSAGFYIAEGATSISGVYIDSSYIKHLISPAAWQNVVAASSFQWHKIRMAFDSASTHKLWTDDVLRTPLSNANLSNVVSQIDTIRLEQYSNTSSIGYFDQVFIGQYLATEPAWGSWGAEETDVTNYSLSCASGSFSLAGTAVALKSARTLSINAGALTLVGSSVTLIGPDIPVSNRYWVGGSGLWTDTAHWSLTSGGAGGATVPTVNDNVHFDSNSFIEAGQHIEFS